MTKNKLGNFVNIKTGKLDANASSPDGEYPFFTCSREPLKISSYSYDCKCVLVAGNGDLNVKYYEGKFDAYQRTYIIESKDETALNTRYLYWFLFKYVEKLRELSIGGVIKYIKLNNLTDPIIPLPSLEDQKRIVKILDQADALRKKRKKAIRLLDEYLKSVFWEMFGDPVNNPKSWEKRLLGDVTDLITDGKHGDSINEENSGYYFISAKDIHDGIIDYSNARQIIKKDFEEVHRRTNLYPGDLIIVNTGATIGKVAIAKEDHRTQRTTFQKSVAVIKLKKNFINNHYLKFLFGLRLKDLFRTSTGSAQQNLLLSQMRKIVITCPPIQLQNQFVSIVEKVELLKHTMLTQSEELENQFQALMQKAFKGTL